MGWVTVDAPPHDDLSSCVQCGLCLPHCPTFRLTGNEAASPRGRLMAMTAVGHGIADVDDSFEEMMWFCLQCRACEAACPSLVPFGRLMEGARAEVQTQRPSTPKRLRHLALGRLLGWRKLMLFVTFLLALLQRVGLSFLLPTTLRKGVRGLRPLPLFARTTAGSLYTAYGDVQGRAGLLAGCVMDPWFGDVNQATIELLRRCGWDVLVPDGQICCGALAAHDGVAEPARRLARRNEEAFADVDIVVTNSAGCGAHLKEYATWSDLGSESLGPKARDVTEVIAAGLASGRLPTFPANGQKAAQQDPCHLRHAQRITSQPRALIQAAGFEVAELDPDGICCGAAGIYSILEPDASAELGRRKAAYIEASGASLVASANPGCEMQLRQHLSSGHRIAHPVELYWEALAAGEGRSSRDQ